MIALIYVHNFSLYSNQIISWNNVMHCVTSYVKSYKQNAICGDIRFNVKYPTHQMWVRHVCSLFGKLSVTSWDCKGIDIVHWMEPSRVCHNHYQKESFLYCHVWQYVQITFCLIEDRYLWQNDCYTKMTDTLSPESSICGMWHSRFATAETCERFRPGLCHSKPPEMLLHLPRFVVHT